MKKKLLITLGVILVMMGTTIVMLKSENNNFMKSITRQLFYGTQHEEFKEHQEIDEMIKKDYKKSDYNIDNPYVIVDPYGLTPLSGYVMFETKEPQKASVTIKGKTDSTSITFDEKEKTKKHFIPFHGLYQDYENTLIISDGTKEVEYKVSVPLLDTGLEITVEQKNNLEPNQIILISVVESELIDEQLIGLDESGELRYIFNSNTWPVIDGEDIYVFYKSENLVKQFNMSGRIKNVYTSSADVATHVHHDIFTLDNGNRLILSSSGEYLEGSLLEYDENGKLIRMIDLHNIFDAENWEYLHMKGRPGDYLHLNSVVYDEVHNQIVLSSRHLGAIFAIDYDTEELLWILGDKTNIPKEYHQYYLEPLGEVNYPYGQHHAQILNSNPEYFDVLVYNNNNIPEYMKEEGLEQSDLGNSLINGYRIYIEDFTFEEIFTYDTGEFSRSRSSVILYDDYLLIDNGDNLKDIDGSVSPTNRDDTNVFLLDENLQKVWEVRINGVRSFRANLFEF